MITKLVKMFQMQHELNAAINPDWLNDESQDWYCAVVVEGAEMIDHYGWKWWKHQTPDIAQVQLELVDIWHFLMSAQLKALWPQHQDVTATIQAAASLWADETLFSTDLDMSFVALAKGLVGKAALGEMPQTEFAALMNQVDFDFSMLFKWYIGKNVLNYFRQDHGYKDGSYIKVWQGREDNEYLADALVQLDVSDNLNEEIYQFLKAAYPA